MERDSEFIGARKGLMELRKSEDILEGWLSWEGGQWGEDKGNSLNKGRETWRLLIMRGIADNLVG